MIKDRRLWLPSLPAVLLIIALFNPRLSINRDSYDIIFVIDITQSMNARDYHIDGMPADRLSFVKHSLKQVFSRLPCGSRIGLSLFTTKNSFLLFEPLEICRHYSPIVTTLMKIDWRMAWAADSYIARGLYTSLKEIDRMTPKPSLVFLTDGQQTPATTRPPRFLQETGQHTGLIVGVGNLQPVPIPRLDSQNIQTGYWLVAEAERHRNATTGSGNYLTAVREQALQRLARLTGLGYHHLEGPEKLAQALRSARLQQRQQVPYPLREPLIAMALAIFITPFVPFRRRRCTQTTDPAKNL